MISIGNTNKEDRQIAATDGIHTLTLRTPLAHAHSVGTPVLMMGAPTNLPMRGAAHQGPCKIERPSGCMFPFSYKGITYTTCTGVDAMDVLWCSTTTQYQGKWLTC